MPDETHTAENDVLTSARRCFIVERLHDAFGHAPNDVLDSIEEIVRERMAEAWRAGAAAGHHSPLTWFALRQVNPYRVIPPAEGDTDE